jgi:hypothetical protein
MWKRVPGLSSYTRPSSEAACHPTVKHESRVFHLTAPGANRRANINRPPPARLVHSAADRQATDGRDLEPGTRKVSYFVRKFEALKDHVHCGGSRKVSAVLQASRTPRGGGRPGRIHERSHVLGDPKSRRRVARYFKILNLNRMCLFTSSACQSMKRNPALTRSVTAAMTRLFQPSTPWRIPPARLAA